MQAKHYLSEMWNQQHRRPRGMVGWLVGAQMAHQHKPETEWTLDLLNILPTDTVLEIGFGAGRGIKLAVERARNGHVMGIDLSETMVRAAARRNAQAVKAGRVTLSQGDVLALPFEEQQFNKIMTIHTVYFWSEPSQALSELYRVLKPGGRSVITLSTGESNSQGEVEVWPPFQALLEEQILPGMQRSGFQAVRLERGPNSRQYTSVAVIGEK